VQAERGDAPQGLGVLRRARAVARGVEVDHVQPARAGPPVRLRERHGVGRVALHPVVAALPQAHHVAAEDVDRGDGFGRNAALPRTPLRSAARPRPLVRVFTF
jgi:hypothetical protein